MFSLIKELFWKAVFMIAVTDYIFHLMMPYGPFDRPAEGEWPEPILITFSKGQLVEYLAHCILLPLIFSVSVALAKYVSEIFVYVGTGLIMGCVMLLIRLRRKIDGLP